MSQGFPPVKINAAYSCCRQVAMTRYLETGRAAASQQLFAIFSCLVLALRAPASEAFSPKRRRYQPPEIARFLLQTCLNEFLWSGLLINVVMNAS